MRYLTNIVVVMFLLTTNSITQNSTSINRKDKDGNKIGTWKAFHPDGSTRYVGQFDKGQPVDTFFYYYPTGELQTMMIHNGVKSAYAKMYYSTGELMAQGKYYEQKKDSIWLTYGANQVLVTKGGYQKGAKFGRWETYYTNGKLAELVFYKNDIEVDGYRSYYDNGNVLEETQYVNGFLEGVSTFYNENGNKILKGIYKKSMRDGKWIYYNSNGTVVKIVEYKDGKSLDENLNVIEIPEELKANRKEYLEFDDIRGKIKYD
jgi:antitoxin component YwqK of YwqJK toxin-antitoxin module